MLAFISEEMGDEKVQGTIPEQRGSHVINMPCSAYLCMFSQDTILFPLSIDQIRHTNTYTVPQNEEST